MISLLLNKMKIGIYLHLNELQKMIQIDSKKCKGLSRILIMIFQLF